jgi:sarcosine oxidase, subunit alpha
MTNRIQEHPVLGKAPLRRRVHFSFDGEKIMALEGDSIASALLANQIKLFRRSRGGEPRGLFCGVGHCYECRVMVDGVASSRACLVQVRDRMVVERVAGASVDGD